MCLICLSLDNKRMTNDEAFSALNEYRSVISGEHYMELVSRLVREWSEEHKIEDATNND